ncbi:MAG: hypothetical protein HZB53_04445 [Chloroflexi bacterium]|nr:hypothetical protein [Chloroflexota bacterium]
MARNKANGTAESTVAQLVVDVRSGAIALQILSEHSGEVIEEASGKDAERLSNRLGLSPSLFFGHRADDGTRGGASEVRAIYAPL